MIPGPCWFEEKKKGTGPSEKTKPLLTAYELLPTSYSPRVTPHELQVRFTDGRRWAAADGRQMAPENKDRRGSDRKGP